MHNLCEIMLRQAVWWLVSPKDNILSPSLAIFNHKFSVISPIIYPALSLGERVNVEIYLLESGEFLIFSNVLVLDASMPTDNEFPKFGNELKEFFYFLRHWSKQHNLLIEFIIERIPLRTTPLPYLPHYEIHSVLSGGAFSGAPHVYAVKFCNIDKIDDLYSKREPIVSEIIFLDAIAAYHRGDYVASLLYLGFSVEILLSDSLAYHKVKLSHNSEEKKVNNKNGFIKYFNEVTEFILGKSLAQTDSKLYTKICAIYKKRNELAHQGYQRSENNYFGEYKRSASSFIKCTKNLFDILMPCDNLVFSEEGAIANKVDFNYFTPVDFFCNL